MWQIKEILFNFISGTQLYQALSLAQRQRSRLVRGNSTETRLSDDCVCLMETGGTLLGNFLVVLRSGSRSADDSLAVYTASHLEGFNWSAVVLLAHCSLAGRRSFHL